MKKILENSNAALFAFGALSALTLGTVYVSQYVFGYAPCELCVYQRIPHMAVIALCVLGLTVSGKFSNAGSSFLAGTGVAYIAGAVIASYHTGVERKWWPSFLEGCTIPQIDGDINDVLARIQAAPLVRCDEIPWVDPVIGLSMANYNALLCIVAALLAFAAAWRSCAVTHRA